MLSDGRAGNFDEFLNYRARGGDLKTYPKNATYILKSVQNDLITCCGDFILDTKVKKNTFSLY